jgi:antitoxin component of RelBE/YafQ-DinJ toxin-antitoxin module
MLWARVDGRVADAVRQIAGLMGISISEYVRRLVLADLDARSVFNTQLRGDAK